MRTIGIDLGRKPAVCEVAEKKVVLRKTLPSTQDLVTVLGPGTGSPAEVAIEACREAWAVADWLKEWGHRPILVDTTRSKQMGIGQHNRKNDRIDAETLARAVAENRVPRAHLLSRPRQQLRIELGIRRMLVETRTSYAIGIRGIARATGVKLPGGAPEDLPEKLADFPMPEELRRQMEPLVEMVKQLEPRLKEVESRIEKLCALEPAHELLKTATGVGPIVSAMYICVIDDARRFDSAHKVEAYIGLVPSENTSGKRKLGSITKGGNPYLRALLVQAAWAVLRSRGADPLKLWGQEVMARRGKRIAVIAVARRLAGILWAMWKRGTVYEPKRLALKSAKGFEEKGQSVLLRAAAFKRAAAKGFGTGNNRSGDQPPAA
jgi:transposase